MPKSGASVQLRMSPAGEVAQWLRQAGGQWSQKSHRSAAPDGTECCMACEIHQKRHEQVQIEPRLPTTHRVVRAPQTPARNLGQGRRSTNLAEGVEPHPSMPRGRMEATSNGRTPSPSKGRPWFGVGRSSSVRDFRAEAVFSGGIASRSGQAGSRPSRSTPASAGNTGCQPTPSLGCQCSGEVPEDPAPELGAK